MGQRYKRFALQVGVVVMLLPFLFCEIVFGAEVNPTIVLEVSNSTAVESAVELCNKYSEEIGNFRYINVKSIEGKKTQVNVNTDQYKELTTEEKKLLMSYALNSIYASNIAKRERSRLYNFVAEQDTATSALVRELSNNTNADISTALSLYDRIAPIVSAILGVITVAIFVLLTIGMLMDIFYMTIPAIRLFLNTKDGEKPSIISNEAFMAIKEAESSTEVYKSCLGVYFKMRVKMLVILGVCLAYLIRGQIFYLVGWFIDAVSNAFFI